MRNERSEEARKKKENIVKGTTRKDESARGRQAGITAHLEIKLVDTGIARKISAGHGLYNSQRSL